MKNVIRCLGPIPKRCPLVVMLLVIVVATIAPTVSAITSLDLQSIFNNTPNYGDNPTACASADGSGSNAGANLSGSDNMQKAFNYFVGQGLNANQSAGIVGNLVAESSVNPKANQAGGPGTGIAQWGNPGRWNNLEAFASKKGQDKFSLGLQLDFVWQELNGSYKAALDDLKKQGDPGGAAVSIMINYEAPADHSPTGPNAHLRTAFAVKILKLYGAGVSASAVSSTTTGGTTTPAVDNTAPTTDSSCLPGANPASGLGQGKGKFTDNTTIQYPGVAQALARAKEIATPGSPLRQQTCGSTCYRKCDHIMAFVWGHAASGYPTAYDHWLALKNTSHGHPGDRNPPVGALLYYYTSTAGHVVVYLGNNKVLSNDVLDTHAGEGGAYITDASSIETTNWHLQYLGWTDPVFGA